MWFRDFFYKCLNAFLAAFSTIGGADYDYSGPWIYAIVGIVLMGLFVIGCIQIIRFVIICFSSLPKIHKEKKIKRKVPWRDAK